ESVIGAEVGNVVGQVDDPHDGSYIVEIRQRAMVDDVGEYILQVLGQIQPSHILAQEGGDQRHRAFQEVDDGLDRRGELVDFLQDWLDEAAEKLAQVQLNVVESDVRPAAGQIGIIRRKRPVEKEVGRERGERRLRAEARD